MTLLPGDIRLLPWYLDNSWEIAKSVRSAAMEPMISPIFSRCSGRAIGRSDSSPVVPAQYTAVFAKNERRGATFVGSRHFFQAGEIVIHLPERRCGVAVCRQRGAIQPGCHRENDVKEAFRPSKVRPGLNDELRGNLKNLAKALEGVFDAIKKNSDADQRMVQLANLALRSSVEAKRLAAWINEPIDQIAWTTRNLLELNIRVRFAVSSPDSVRRFRSEMVSDEIECLTGFLKLTDTATSENRDIIRQRISFRKKRLETDGLQVVKPLPIKDAAVDVGLGDEYEAFYKIYSKCVHPSSLLVNNSQGFAKVFEQWGRPLLQLNAQQYAHDTFCRVAEAAAIPITDLHS